MAKPRPPLRTLDEASLRQVVGGDPKPPIIKVLDEDRPTGQGSYDPTPPPVILK